MTMPSVQHRDTSREIDISPAVHIPELRILGPCDVEILGRDSTGHCAFMAGRKGGCCAHQKAPNMHWFDRHSTISAWIKLKAA
jgi:hypothetical protein